MAKTLTQEECIKRCQKAHPGKKYDYSKSIYTRSDVKMTIICPVHGEFQQRPADHWKGRGCDKCGKGMYDWETYKEKANKKHNHRYSYPDQLYTQTRDRITITCEKHGNFTQVASMHLIGQGCWDCAQEEQRASQEDFLRKSRAAHGDYYDYSKSIYTTKDGEVTITCPIHGDFQQEAEEHYHGHGCKKCNAPEGRLCKTTMERYSEKYKNTKGRLYLLHCFNDIEEFCKIGITSQKIKERFNSIVKMPYEYNIIKDISMDLYNAFYIEQDIQEHFERYKHYPEIYFGGHTEAIHIDCLEDIKSKIDELLKPSQISK